MLDISFTCSSVRSDEREINTSGVQKSGGREVQNGRRGENGRSFEKEKLKRVSPGQLTSAM